MTMNRRWREYRVQAELVCLESEPDYVHIFLALDVDIRLEICSRETNASRHFESDSAEKEWTGWRKGMALGGVMGWLLTIGWIQLLWGRCRPDWSTSFIIRRIR